jgi:hypothetical protein
LIEEQVEDVNALCTNEVGIAGSERVASKEVFSVPLNDEVKLLITHKVREATDVT